MGGPDCTSHRTSCRRFGGSAENVRLILAFGLGAPISPLAGFGRLWR